jgi:hypothetical protein
MLAALVFFSSCSFQHNLCLNGLTLWHTNAGSIRQPEANRQEKTELEKRIPFSEKEHSALIAFETQPFFQTDQPKKRKVQAELKRKKLNEGKNTLRKILFSHSNKKTLPVKPKDSKFKISVSKINALAFISFLMVPLFIASLFTSSIFFILSTFCIGVILATICGFLADGRKGCWMVGIAIGFWVVIVLYMGLLLFIF